MECPACGRPVQQHKLPDGSIDFSCGSCGWGQGPPPPEWQDEPARPSLGRLGLYWVLAVLVVLGPYLALRIGVPMLLDTGVQAFAEASDRFVGALNVHYWWVAAAYVFLSAAFSPTYDHDKLGWFGGYIDNPFSWQDDWERQKRTWAAILLPGKVVVAAITLTWKTATSR